MNETSDLLLTRTTDGHTVVSLPETAMSDKNLQATRAQLIALADSVYDGELHLDFTRIGYLGSSALAVLVSVHRRIADAGGQLVLCNLAPYLEDLFRLTRLDTLLHVRSAATS